MSIDVCHFLAKQQVCGMRPAATLPPQRSLRGVHSFPILFPNSPAFPTIPYLSPVFISCPNIFYHLSCLIYPAPDFILNCKLFVSHLLILPTFLSFLRTTLPCPVSYTFLQLSSLILISSRVFVTFLISFSHLVFLTSIILAVSSSQTFLLHSRSFSSFLPT